MDDSPAPSSTSTEKKQKQACDNCRRRKIKCNRANPCDKCQRLLLSCSYSDVLQRKGPKFRTLYPLAPLHPLSAQYQSATRCYQPYGSGSNRSSDVHHHKLNSPALSTFPTADGQAPAGGCYARCCIHSAHELASSSGSTDSQCESSAGSEVLPYVRRLSSPILLAHVNVYLKYLFPIMPVVRREQLLLDSQNPSSLSPQRYAFMAALCAATHIQLKLDGAGPVSSASDGNATANGSSLMSGEALLAEAVRARKEYDVIENVNVETLLTSFFLFAAYGNLDKQDHAWFYLSQSISMAHTLGLHRESTYSSMVPEEAEEKRRVFWLLFVTERAYALQRTKPIMLRSSIQKPKVLYSDDPILAYGFLNLINIFEKLSADLYDWVSIGCNDEFSAAPPTGSIQSDLCKPISLTGVLEIQQVDILVTQQWLQAMMWKLSMGRVSQQAARDGAMLPFHLPVVVGKTVMDVIGSVSQGAVDAHGIGMEQKLFDMGASIADVARFLRTPATQRLAVSVADPRELLWGILNILSKIRGSQSYLFPALLERSSSVLRLDSPTTLSNFLPNFSDELSPINERKRPLESISTEEEVQEDVDENNMMGRALNGMSGMPPQGPFSLT